MLKDILVTAPSTFLGRICLILGGLDPCPDAFVSNFNGASLAGWKPRSQPPPGSTCSTPSSIWMLMLLEKSPSPKINATGFCHPGSFQLEIQNRGKNISIRPIWMPHMGKNVLRQNQQMAKPCAVTCPSTPSSPPPPPPPPRLLTRPPTPPSSPSPLAPRALPRGWWSATGTWSPKHSAMSATENIIIAPSPTSRTPPWLGMMQTLKNSHQAILPMFHIFGLGVTMTGCLWSGAKQVTLPK